MMENSYLYIVVCLFSVALSSFLAYGGARGREMRLALGVILLASLIPPISSAVKGFSELQLDVAEEYTESSLVERTVEEAVCLGIAEALADEISQSASDISVSLSGFDSEKMSADGVRVTLKGKAAFSDIKKAESFVSELGFGKCTAEVYFG